MTKQMQAALHIANYRSIKDFALPAINVEQEEIHFDKMNYGVLSGGQKSAISWLWCVWKDQQVPETDDGDPEFTFNLAAGVRDPFAGFGNLDRELQTIILEAIAIRHS